MTRSRISLFLLLPCLLAPVWGAGASSTLPSDPELMLRDLTDRQVTLFREAEEAGDDLDEMNFRTHAQRLAQDYDDFLKRFPDYPPVYAAYGLMLNRLDLRRQSAAILTKGEEVFTEMAEDEGAQTPAFRKDWALLRNLLGNYVAEEGHPVEASVYFLGAIDLVPDEPLYHYQLGTLLTDAQDEFLLSGDWTRATLEDAMHEAFRQAAELAPDRIEFVYRYGESFYDLTNPDWDEALTVWSQLEADAQSEVERETMQLHRANVLLRQGKPAEARAALDSVTESVLQAQRQKLIDQIDAAGAE